MRVFSGAVVSTFFALGVLMGIPDTGAETLFITDGKLQAIADTIAGNNTANVRGYRLGGSGVLNGETFSLRIGGCCPPLSYPFQDTRFGLAPGTTANFLSTQIDSTFGSIFTFDGVSYDQPNGFSVSIRLDISTPTQTIPIQSGRVVLSAPFTAIGQVSVSDLATNIPVLDFALIGAGSANAASFMPDAFALTGLYPLAQTVDYTFIPVPEPSGLRLGLIGTLVLAARYLLPNCRNLLLHVRLLKV
jgi:hypothetical protein